MRHNKSGRRLGRTTSHRVAMFRNMITSFLSHERITTTDAKAKELRSIADKMITLGKKGDLHARREALKVIRSKRVAKILFDEIAPRYAQREGGYVRVIKKGVRPGDCAAVSLVELVEKRPPEQAKAKISEKAKGLKDKIVDRLKSRSK